MGREERVNEAMRAAELERVMGPTRPFRHYDESGCPKCGQVEIKDASASAFRRMFCTGANRLSVETPKCPYDGEHLHVGCNRCGYGWTERCADYQPEPLVTIAGE